MAEPTPSEKAEAWEDVGEQIFAGFITAWLKSDVAKALTAILTDVIAGLTAAGVSAMAPVGIGLAKGFAKSEELVAPALAPMAAAAVNDMFGTKVDASAFEGGIQNGRRVDAATALADGLLKQFRGTDAALEPSDDATTRYLGVVVNMALEGWYQKWFFEYLSSCIPELNVGQIENFGSLDDKVAEALGLGRLTRRVLSPLVDTTIVTPLEWQTNKTYRPNLLSAGEVVRQVARGRWTLEQGQEELARQGWSDARIEALLNTARKFHSVSDVYRFARAGELTQDQALQHLRDQGYDELTAANELKLEKLRTIEVFERELAGLAVTAFANRNIDRAQLDDFCDGATITSQERQQLLELADARRLFRTKQLSAEETRSAVRDGILDVLDYRAALARDGYDHEASIVKELQLRKELEDDAELTRKKTEAADRRRQLEAERAAERVQRQEEAERKAAAARRGDETELEDAAIRGALPLSAVRAVYDVRVDADVADVLMTVLEQKRGAYVEQQKQAELARQRAAATGLNIGDVEAAVLVGNLSLEEFRTHPALARLAPADVDLLASTLTTKLRVAEQAKADRDEAREKLKDRPIDLARFELLVRRGVRTMAQYRELLASVGFNAVAIAGMVDALTLRIADDGQTKEIKKRLGAELTATGLTVDELRRAIVLGIRPRSEYVAALLALNVSAALQALLIAELEEAVSEAAAARRRRQDQAPTVEGGPLWFVELAADARLGLITPATYLAALTARGLDDADISREIELLTTEIADVQSVRRVRAAIDAGVASTELTLGELAGAVKRGLATLDDYRARAIVLGRSNEAADTLVRVLADELRALNIARQQKAKISSELNTRELSLGELEEQVRAGALSLDGYGAQLVDWGLSDVDVELLWSLLEDEIGNR